MTVTITQFRKQLFELAEQSLAGEKVEFLYRGVVFQVNPQNKVRSKVEKLVGQPVVAEGFDPEQSGKELMEAMEAEWQRKWAALDRSSGQA